jgi:hypothetical protein
MRHWDQQGQNRSAYTQPRNLGSAMTESICTLAKRCRSAEFTKHSPRGSARASKKRGPGLCARTMARKWMWTCLALRLRRLRGAGPCGAADRLDYNLWFRVNPEPFARPPYDAVGIRIHGPRRVQRGAGGQARGRFTSPKFNCPTSGPIASG